MRNRILNLTQHLATNEQVSEGVYEPSDEDKNEIKRLLTVSFEDRLHLDSRVAKLIRIVFKYELDGGKVMIGGALPLMLKLQEELVANKINPHHSFTERVSKEENGVKVSVFAHVGWW